MGQVASACQDCHEKVKIGSLDWEAIATKSEGSEDFSTTIDIYPERIHGNPPNSFSDAIDKACAEIHEAVKGWGTDEKGLIKALASKKAGERYEIYLRYEELYKKNLKDVMRSKCGSRAMGLALQLLALPADEAEAMMIRVGFLRRYLYPILCGRSNAEIAILRRAYFLQYGKDLSLEIHFKVASGDFKKFLYHCLQGTEETYEEYYHTEARAKEDAAAFFKAGEGKWGTDEKGIFKLICRSPPPHMIKINKNYETGQGKSLLDVLDSELGGNVERACVYAMGMKLQPYRTVARQIKLACKGFGTDELGLTMLIIRYQSILPMVDDAHKEMYGKSLAERIDEETSGLYKYLLLEVIKAAA